jgi:branched-chain amino acid transport system substrate-binding protein
MEIDKIYLKIILTLVVSFGLTGCSGGDAIKKNKQSWERNGVYNNEIVLGSSSALTGHAGYLGKNYLMGAMAYFKNVNSQGGINGRMIRIYEIDDQYDPAKCIYNTQRLINYYKVFSLFNYVGTPTSVKTIPMINEAGIPLVGIFSGAQALRQPVNKYIFNLRGSYYLETERAILHFTEDLGLKRVSIFYQNDAYGLDVLSGTNLALSKRGLKPVSEASYIRGTMDIDAAVNTIASSGPEVVIMAGTYDPTAKFVRSMIGSGNHPLFYSVSFVGADELSSVLGPDRNGVIVSQTVPPNNEDFPAIKEYKQMMMIYYPDDSPGFVGLEGFLNAKIIVEGLKRAGNDLTRSGFISALESLKQYDIGIGYNVTFDKTDHEGFDRMFFTLIKDDKFELIKDWKEYKNELNVGSR